MSDNEYQFRELRKEIDYLTDEVTKLRRLVRNIREMNRLTITADD
jgi:hypothetical protein